MVSQDAAGNNRRILMASPGGAPSGRHQTRSIGAGVLTGNVGDFDFLNQLVPGVPIILYRQA